MDIASYIYCFDRAVTAIFQCNSGPLKIDHQLEVTNHKQQDKTDCVYSITNYYKWQLAVILMPFDLFELYEERKNENEYTCIKFRIRATTTNE